MRLLVLAVVVVIGAGTARAQDGAPGLSGNGAYDAVTIGGFVLPLHDVDALLAADILRLDPASHHFSFTPEITSEHDLRARLKTLSLEKPRAPGDLYRAAKVPLPNGAAHELTIPSGFGPAVFANQQVGTSLSASLGGVSRVPYTDSPDGALGFGLSFGNSFTGLGASIQMSFNDLSKIGNPDRISWGINVSRYISDGVSVSVGGENLFVKTTDGESSFYVAGSWAFDKSHDNMPFDGVLTLGAGSGRFANMTQRDVAEGKSAHGSTIFGGISWEVTDRFNLITEWNGRNLNMGMAYSIPKTRISVKLGVENLTGNSGDGPILTGSLGMTLARF